MTTIRDIINDAVAETIKKMQANGGDISQDDKDHIVDGAVTEVKERIVG